jgi:hypothetical protein
MTDDNERNTINLLEAALDPLCCNAIRWRKLLWHKGTHTVVTMRSAL